MLWFELVLVESVEFGPAGAGDVAGEADRGLGVARGRVAGDGAGRELGDHHFVAGAGLAVAVPVLEDGTHAAAPETEGLFEGN